MKLPLDGWRWGSGEHPASWSPTPAPGTWKDGPSTLCRPLHLHLHRVKPPPFKDPASSCPRISFPGLFSGSQTLGAAPELEPGGLSNQPSSQPRPAAFLPRQLPLSWFIT